MSENIRIAVDAMGGDFAPAEVVRGALTFAQTCGNAEGASRDAEVLLVGQPETLQAELESAAAAVTASAAAHGAVTADPDATIPIRIVPASQVIEMHDHPMEAFRAKKDSSIVVCANLVRSGEAHAAFSAGNTGAVMVAATQIMERIEGVKRPAIATMMPTETGGYTVVVDAGANVDCRASHLLQFALLGSVYAERVLGVANPRVGLLANGEEESKGNDLSREAFGLLKATPQLNFIGNIEGNHVFEGKADVIVCDGFVGNVLLKGAEGTVRLVLSLLARDAKRAQDETVREALLESLLRSRQQVDYSETGGAPLLGVNGVSIIAHGRSDAKAIANGLRVAVRAARSGYVEAVKTAIREAQA